MLPAMLSSLPLDVLHLRGSDRGKRGRCSIPWHLGLFSLQSPCQLLSVSLTLPFMSVAVEKVDRTNPAIPRVIVSRVPPYSVYFFLLSFVFFPYQAVSRLTPEFVLINHFLSGLRGPYVMPGIQT